MRKGRSRTLQSTKYLQKKRKRLVINLSLIFVCIVSFIGLTIMILRLPSLQIKNINVVGAQTLSVEEIKTKALQSMEGKYFNLIPKTSAIFYSKEEVKQALTDTFKKIDSVEIDHGDVGALNITIKESEPDAIVCEGFRDDENHEDCFFVDGKGYVFERATQFSDGVYLKYYVNLNSDPITIGKSFIEENKFKELQKFSKSINNAGIPTAGILISESGSYELYIKNGDKGITVVYFDDRTPFDKTFSNFIAFWQSAKDKKLGLSTVPVFDYINLRFGNNIFYTTK